MITSSNDWLVQMITVVQMNTSSNVTSSNVTSCECK